MRDVARVGRFGWINLLPLLPGTDGSRAALLDAVAGLDAEDLHAGPARRPSRRAPEQE